MLIQFAFVRDDCQTVWTSCINMDNDKVRKVFAVSLLVVFLVTSYMFSHLNKLNVYWKPQPPPAAINENDHLFKALTIVGPNQLVQVEIMYNGKYTMKSDNFSFSYKVKYFPLDGYKTGLAVAKKKSNTTTPPKWNGYVKVMAVGEELSKSMTNFLTLAYPFAPGLGRMKLVAPRIRDSSSALGATGYPIELFFNFDNLNRLLSNSGYSILAKEEEHEQACKGQTTFIVQEFKNPMAKSWLLTQEVRHELFEKRGGDIWVDCTPKNVKDVNDTKRYVCTKEFNVTRLQKNALKDAKCIVIPKWNDHGGRIAIGGEPHPLSIGQIFTWFATPSDTLMEEAQRFEELFLERPYVAIHIRSCHIRVMPSTLERCFKLAMEFVKALKSTRNVKSLFLSSDMTKYGSVASSGYARHSKLVAMSGAVTYSPNATGKVKLIQKATVSLTEMLLQTRSDHLITLGSGSFHGFIVNKFHVHHVNIDPSKWSLIKICNNARNRGR